MLAIVYQALLHCPDANRNQTFPALIKLSIRAIIVQERTLSSTGNKCKWVDGGVQDHIG